jgi:hypothetical protein
MVGFLKVDECVKILGIEGEGDADGGCRRVREPWILYLSRTPVIGFSTRVHVR